MQTLIIWLCNEDARIACIEITALNEGEPRITNLMANAVKTTRDATTTTISVDGTDAITTSLWHSLLKDRLRTLNSHATFLQVMKTPIDDLNASRRLSNALYMDGQKYLWQCVAQTEAEVANIQGIGPKTMEELKALLVSLLGERPQYFGLKDELMEVRFELPFHTDFPRCEEIPLIR